MAIPLLAAAAIDDGILPGDSAVIWRYTLIMLAIGVVQGLASGLRRYIAFRIAYRTETDLRQRLFAHLQRLHFAFHDEAQTGQLMARANTDIQQINQVVILIPLTIASSLILVAVVTIMAMQSIRCSRCSALGALPLLNVVGDAVQPQDPAGRPRAAAGARRPLGRGRGERLRRAGGEGVRRRAAAGHAGSTPRPTRVLRPGARGGAAARRASCRSSTSCPTLALVAILWYGGHQVLDGQLELGDIVAFNSTSSC